MCSVKTQNGEDRLISTTGEKTLDAEVAVFFKATQSVFEVGFQTPLYRDDPEPRWGSGVDGSTVIIGIKGASCWNLMVCPSPDAASVLAGKFFQTEAAEISVALQEVGRRIGVPAAASLSGLHGEPMTVGSPTVVTGSEYKVSTPAESKTCKAYFEPNLSRFH